MAENFNDRAWNDPPPLSFQSDSQPPKQKTLLNKRVAFPGDGKGLLLPKQQAGEDKNLVILPPASNTIIPSVCPAMTIPPTVTPTTKKKDDIKSESQSVSLVDSSSDDELLKTILSIFNKGLQQCQSSLQPRKIEEISKRMAAFESMWTEGKFNKDIKAKMYQLTKAFSSGDYTEANNLHLGLIVDYPGQVSSWMVGIKHLIHQANSIGLVLDDIDTLPASDSKEIHESCSRENS